MSVDIDGRYREVSPVGLSPFPPKVVGDTLSGDKCGKVTVRAFFLTPSFSDKMDGRASEPVLASQCSGEMEEE